MKSKFNYRKFSFFVSIVEKNVRLDVCIAKRLSCSRSIVIYSAHNNMVCVNGASKKPSYKVSKGDFVLGYLREKSLNLEIIPEYVPLDIVYEDSNVLVINKEAGVVVHPSPGHFSGTIVNAILARYPELKTIFGSSIRPGIVHRLDKDTTGLLVIAKTLKAFQNLSFQFKTRSLFKCYLALVHGVPDEKTGTIDFSIGRGRIDRKKMSINSLKPRKAETRWKLVEQFGSFMSLLELNIKTGRTHQVRVHCKSIGHPIVGDQIYGGKKTTIKTNKVAGREFTQSIARTKRQMLHAYKIEFLHPIRKEKISLKKTPPSDMIRLTSVLRKEFPK